MKKYALIAITAASIAIGNMQAGQDYKAVDKKVVVPVETCRFRDMEWQIDGFYSAFIGSSNSHFNTGSGGGFGVNFFFAKYFGVGYEGQWYSNAGTAQHLPIGGNLFLRYPICKWNLAPYAMVGGGGTWDGYGTGYGNVGGGAEYRFTNNFGIFTDARYFYGGTGNVTNIRAGIRIAF